MSAAAAKQSAGTKVRSLTAHIFREDLLGLFPKQGLDFKRVAQIAQLTKEDLGKLGKVSKASVRFDEKIPVPVADRLRELANIANLVAEYFNGDVKKVELWFSLANPLLGNISPRDMIRLGRYERLLNFVLDARDAEAQTPAKNKAK